MLINLQDRDKISEKGGGGDEKHFALFAGTLTCYLAAGEVGFLRCSRIKSCDKLQCERSEREMVLTSHLKGT